MYATRRDNFIACMKKRQIRSDKMSSQIRNGCVRIHYEYINWNVIQQTVPHIFCMQAEQMRDAHFVRHMYMCGIDLKHGKRIISRHLIVILLSIRCLFTCCKSIFNYLLFIQRPNMVTRCTRYTAHRCQRWCAIAMLHYLLNATD